ncbi:hypothetical protein [Sediminibacterium salmoneum]|uniref:hypothetical protein n=1 Tax=Sediminibacterium salmoneum TaxID=426421 RepID=UPI000687B69C|nr:hypothetical protein [Sediminibacterium salmoneum]
MENKTIKLSSKQYVELFLISCGIIIATFIAKIPQFFGLTEDEYYAKNLSFIIVPTLMAYFIWKKEIDFKKAAIALVVIILSWVYMNLLPSVESNDSLILACMHMPILAWTILGFIYIKGEVKNSKLKIEYLIYNSNLAVMSAMLVISGFIFSALTIGMFNLIEVKIETFYFNYVVITGLSAVPLIASYLVENNAGLVNKITPLIAKIFTPLVLIMLTIFTITLFATGKSIYSNRDFLLIFNLVLIGVMALILFSVIEANKLKDNRINTILLLLLSTVTIIVNGIALSAILFRLSEFGVSANRIAVLGANLIIFTNLILVFFKLVKATKKKDAIEEVANTIVSYLPVYGGWAFIVAFLFPLIFQYK